LIDHAGDGGGYYLKALCFLTENNAFEPPTTSDQAALEPPLAETRNRRKMKR
jgi:hypothetical protein